MLVLSACFSKEPHPDLKTKSLSICNSLVEENCNNYLRIIESIGKYDPRDRTQEFVIRAVELDIYCHKLIDSIFIGSMQFDGESLFRTKRTMIRKFLPAGRTSLENDLLAEGLLVYGDIDTLTSKFQILLMELNILEYMVRSVNNCYEGSWYEPQIFKFDPTHFFITMNDFRGSFDDTEITIDFIRQGDRIIKPHFYYLMHSDQTFGIFLYSNENNFIAKGKLEFSIRFDKKMPAATRNSIYRSFSVEVP